MTEEIKWITINGVHIPIKPGQTKDEAVKEFTDKQEANASLKEKTSTELADSLRRNLPSDKWQYIGIDQRIKALEDALIGAKSVNKINAIAKSIRAQENIVLSEIKDIESGVNTDGDLNSLKTQLRKLRMLKNKAII